MLFHFVGLCLMNMCVFMCVCTPVCLFINGYVCVYNHLNSLHQAVAELQGCCSSRCAEGRCPPLEAADNAAVPPVLLYGHPEQIPHSMD